MPRNQLSDEALVERTRGLLTKRRESRWYGLLLGVALVGCCIYSTATLVQALNGQDSIQMSVGFFTGIALALLWTSCGVLGAVFLARSLSGFAGGMRTAQLLVRYHDRLREVGALPDDRKGEHGAAPNGGPATPPGNSRATEGPPSVS